ncbi:Urb2 domain-containing protein [Mycena indigotica]|uniref:Urb2 domain-containing protein n=1 Tax=Mycena indigotica TaxID=2126181 RepID=A0A8H6VQR3_9AGAR|nr:Urb2 domain-containing protein [Mycena indigotica]KAF7290567.1 Urb2 domain-containing protein [Mycena indigotica]
MGLEIISSLRYAIGNTSNKKKLFALFVQNHLHDWISSVKEPTAPESLYFVGTEILFNEETLRPAHDEDHALFVGLRNALSESTLSVLPRLYLSFVTFTKKHRSSLFGQSSAPNAVGASDHVRTAAFTFFDSCSSLLSLSGPTSSTWLARNALLEVIIDEKLFDVNDLDAQMSLQGIGPLILSTLSLEYDEQQVSLAVKCLTNLMRIDHDLILKDVPRILPALLTISEPLPSIHDFLQILLQYHIQTRSLQTYIETLFTSLMHSPSSVASSIGRTLGAFLHIAHLERLSVAIETFLTPSQIAPTIELVTADLQSKWQQISALKHVDFTLARAFSASAELTAVIVKALPLRALADPSRRQVQATLKMFKEDFLATAISKSLKSMRKDVGSSETQFVLTALLRLAYSLDLPASDKLRSKMQSLLDDQRHEPGPLFRSLLKWSSTAEPSAALALNEALLAHLKNGPDLDILSMLLERWLPTIDGLMSSSQLETFVTILFNTPLNTSASYQDASPSSVLLSGLSSAEFWELTNIRAAISKYVDEKTTHLLSEELSQRRLTASSTYALLLLFPVESFSRTTRNDLVNRAIDIDISLMADHCPELREFIQNVASSTGAVETASTISSRYLSHLVHNAQDTPVTLSLIELHLLVLIKSSESSDADAVVELLTSIRLDQISKPGSSSQTTVLSHLLTILSSTPHLPNNVSQTLGNIIRDLTTVLSAQVEAIGRKDALLHLWRSTRLLGQRLCIIDDLPLIGRSLCASIQKQEKCGVAFSILLEELVSFAPAERQPHLGYVLAAYVHFGRFVNLEGQRELDHRVSRTCHSMKATDFSSLLTITSACLGDVLTSKDDLPHLVRFASLLLSSHPPGTLKVTQKFFAGCVNISVARPEFTRVEVIRLVRHYCSEQPASLRISDMGNIWLLLSKFLSRSKQHDTVTSADMLQDITFVVGALIRLRRDLVVLALPNLSFVLQQILSTLRRPRPHLGAKQASLIKDLLPEWINPETAVSLDEARSISRLLSALETKTTVRTHAEVVQKAESLAKAFSKHAAYVLKAYIDAMNDPLCLLPSSLRKELRPGLYALCGMINEHSRDALMASALDAGGKAILKNLWAEYEKQKYVGKG